MVGEDRDSVFERSTQCLQNMSYELISLSDRDFFAQSLNAKPLSLLENTPAAPWLIAVSPWVTADGWDWTPPLAFSSGKEVCCSDCSKGFKTQVQEAIIKNVFDQNSEEQGQEGHMVGPLSCLCQSSEQCGISHTSGRSKAYWFSYCLLVELE